MIAAEVMVPCMSFAPTCRMDWAAISAMGGWAAAVVTFFAVLLPFRQYRREFKAREDEDRTDAEIAARSIVMALSSIHTGLEDICRDLHDPHGIDDFTQTLDHVRKHIISTPLPALPRSPRLRDVRICTASLDATMSNFKVYVETDDEGRFGAESVREYLITIDLACGFFNAVVANLDYQFPKFGFSEVLVPLDQGPL